MAIDRPNAGPGAPALDQDRTVRRLLVPVTEESAPTRVIEVAGSLATSWNIPVSILHVSPSISCEDAVLDSVVPLLKMGFPGVEVTGRHLHGEDPAVAIADHCGPDSLLVMSSDHIDRWRVKGSVAEDVIDRLGGPVLLIGPNVSLDDLRSGGLDGDVVIGLGGSDMDGGEGSVGGLKAAVALASSLQRSLRLAHVHRSPNPGESPDVESAMRLQQLADELDAQVPTGWEVIHGADPVTALVSFADRNDAAILVAPRRGRSTEKSTMASISAGLASVANQPVLVVAYE